jgi:two-component system, NarL family, sensor kinase
VGIALGVVGMVMAAVGFWLAWGPGHRSLSGLVHDNTLNNAGNGIWISALAIVLLRLRPANRIGWLVLWIALANSITIFGSGWALASYHVDLPGRGLAAWWASWAWAPAFLLGSSLLLLIYPSGRTVSRFGHRLAMASLVSAAGLSVGLGLLDGPYDSVVVTHHLGTNPISHGENQVPLVVLTVASALLGVVVAFATWGHTARRPGAPPVPSESSWPG